MMYKDILKQIISTVLPILITLLSAPFLPMPESVRGLALFAILMWAATIYLTWLPMSANDIKEQLAHLDEWHNKERKGILISDQEYYRRVNRLIAFDAIRFQPRVATSILGPTAMSPRRLTLAAILIPVIMALLVTWGQPLIGLIAGSIAVVVLGAVECKNVRNIIIVDDGTPQKCQLVIPVASWLCIEAMMATSSYFCIRIILYSLNPSGNVPPDLAVTALVLFLSAFFYVVLDLQSRKVCSHLAKPVRDGLLVAMGIGAFCAWVTTILTRSILLASVNGEDQWLLWAILLAALAVAGICAAFFIRDLWNIAADVAIDERGSRALSQVMREDARALGERVVQIRSSLLSMLVYGMSAMAALGVLLH